MKTEKTKLKGSVLFTVVSVLSIMIIFMTCTLAMASAANKRSKKTYSSSQSTYTARTAIDSMLAAVGTSKDFADAIKGLSLNQEMAVVVDLGENSLGTISNAKFKNIGTKTVYDASQQKWVERTLYSLSCDVTIGGETTSIESRILQDPPQDPPQDSPGFMTYGSAHIGTYTSVWGGTYIGMGRWTKEVGGKTVTKTYTDGDLQNFYEWSPSYDDDDNFLVDDSVLFTPMDHRYWSTKNYKTQNDNVIEAPFVVNGSLECVNTLELYYTKKNQGAVIWGDLTLDNDPALYFNMSEPLLSELATVNSYSDLPYLYVDGKLTSNNKIVMKHNVPVNIYCGTIETASKVNNFDVYSNIYCMDDGGTSKIGALSTNLYSWTSATVNGDDGVSKLGGSLYSNGNVEITAMNGMKITGDLRVAGDLVLNDTNLTVDGSVAVGGKLILKGSKKLTVNDKNIMTSHAKEPGKTGSGIYADAAMSADGNTQISGAEMKEGYTVEESEAIYVKGLNFKDKDGNKPQWCWCNSGVNDYANANGITPEEKHNDNPPFDYLDFSGKGGPEENAVTSSFIVGTTWSEWEFQTPKMLPGRYLDPEGNEVPMDEAYDLSAAKFEGKDIFSIKTFTNYAGDIYPEYATRDALLGISWPVEGMQYGEYIKQLPGDVSIEDNYDGSYYSADKTLDISTNSKLTGMFECPINVTADGRDVYIVLEDFYLMVSKPENSKITVNKKNGGRVFFVLARDIYNNYTLDEERAKLKKINTVYETMNKYKLEQVDDAPPGGLPTFDVADYGYSSSNKVPEAGLLLNDSSVKSGKYASGVVIKNIPDASYFANNNKMKFTVTPPSSGDYWIVLDGTNGGGLTLENLSIDVDDTTGAAGKVKIYIKGNVYMKASSKIITKKYRDFMEGASGAPDYIYFGTPKPNGINAQTAYVPNIEIYAPTDFGSAKLTLDNDVMITAYIRAVGLNMKTMSLADRSTLLSKIYYDGVLQSSPDVKVTRFAVIGCLNVGEFDGGDQPMRVLYVPQDIEESGVVDANGEHSYDAVEYLVY